MVHKNIRLLGIINFLTDFRLYSPVAILYFAQVTGSYTKGMMVFSCTMLGATVFEIPSGVLSDVWGRKIVLLLGALAGTCAVAGYTAASGIPEFGFQILAAGALMEGLSRALYSGNNQALLYDSLRELAAEEDFSQYMGKLGSFFQIALGISAVIGTILAQISYRLVFGLSVIFQAAILVFGVFLSEPRRFQPQTRNVFKQFSTGLRLFFKDPKVPLVSISNGISQAFGEAAFQFQAAFIKLLWPVWAIGISRGLSNAGAALSFWYSGTIIKRFGEIPILIAVRLSGRIIETIALLFPNPVSPVLFSSTSLGFGLSVVSGESYMQKRFTEEQRATMGSIGPFIFSILFIFISPFIGFLADTLGPIRALLITQLCMLVPIIGLIKANRMGFPIG